MKVGFNLVLYDRLKELQSCKSKNFQLKKFRLDKLKSKRRKEEIKRINS